MSATGFGICGQKNSYSSRTKCGNWVEDRIGKAMAATLAKAPRPALGSTVERDDFIHPARMTNTTVLSGDDTEVMSAADIKDKNREGVSFDLLFGHVRDSQHADDLRQGRFLTNAWESFPVTSAMPAHVREGSARARESRARRRLAEIARDRRQTNTLTTTAKLQSTRASNYSDQQQK